MRVLGRVQDRTGHLSILSFPERPQILLRVASSLIRKTAVLLEITNNFKSESCGANDAEVRLTFKAGPYSIGNDPTDLALTTLGSPEAGKFEFTGILTVGGVPQAPATLQVSFDDIFDLSVNLVQKWKKTEAYLKGETLRRIFIRMEESL